MALNCKGKDLWPELVGVKGEIAAATIERENPNVDAIVVREGTGVIENISCIRVWVWVNRSNGKVSRTPKIG